MLGNMTQYESHMNIHYKKTPGSAYSGDREFSESCYYDHTLLTQRSSR